MRGHPIKLLRKEKRLTYQKIAETIRQANSGNGPSAQLLAQYVGGFKKPSPRYADMIHRAFPKINREDLLYFPNDAA
jgi:transcriptional regulator with XRE-family HTH domain